MLGMVSPFQNTSKFLISAIKSQFWIFFYLALSMHDPPSGGTVHCRIHPGTAEKILVNFVTQCYDWPMRHRGCVSMGAVGAMAPTNLQKDMFGTHEISNSMHIDWHP